MTGVPEHPRIRLWMKLAALIAGLVVALHAVRLVIGASISSRALAREQAALGRRIARLLAENVTEPLLVGDRVALHEIVAGAAGGDDAGIVYCFVVREGRVAASSFAGPTLEALVAARPAGDREPIVIVRDGTRVLDIAEPILGGSVGEIRIGFATGILDEARRDLQIKLGLLTVAVIAAGLVAAFAIGRRIARPVSEMLATADHFDPASDDSVPSITSRGSDEIAVLASRLNRMMLRLRSAHLEAEAVRQRSMDAQRLAALGTLMAGFAHEVNNPLAGLMNCVRRFERSDLPEPKRAEYVAHMRRGLQRIVDLVQRFLDFGRAGRIAPEPTGATDLARGAIDIVRPLLGERGVQCALEEPAAQPPAGEDGGNGLVVADRREIERALVNLLLNAIHVTAPGGRIRMALRSRGPFRGIAVADDGPGIPPEIRDRILDPFFTTKPVGEGSGLGLTVTRAIVDAHGGELTFEFPDGRGTVATVWLRRCDAALERRVAI